MTQAVPAAHCSFTDTADVEAAYSNVSYMDAYAINDGKGDTTGGVPAPSPKLMKASLAVTASVLFAKEETFAAHSIVFVHSGRMCDDLQPHLQQLAEAGRAVNITERRDDLSPLLTGLRYAAHIKNGELGSSLRPQATITTSCC